MTPLDTAPSISTWLAAVAARTTRMRIGSMVHLLPFYHPVRLLEEIAMLDHLSGGRLELGVGRGICRASTSCGDSIRIWRASARRKLLSSSSRA